MGNGSRGFEALDFPEELQLNGTRPSCGYWLDLFTAVTWQEFLDAGGVVSGFRESRWNTLQKTKVGDYFLCYLTGVSRWIGLLEVTSEPFRDTSEIWKDESFPCRVKVKVIAKLTPETGIPVREMKDQLSVFQTTGAALAWTGHFRGSPTRWKVADGEAVVKAVLEAAKSPVVRPIDPAKLKYRPTALKAKIGLVTVPESEPTEEPQQEVVKEPAAHTEIQWLLLKLGSDMGFNVWVARNAAYSAPSREGNGGLTSVRSLLDRQTNTQQGTRAA